MCVLVHWINSNSCSVLPSSALVDAAMLKNHNLIGKVYSIQEGKKEPVKGWTKHDGRVLYAHDKKKNVQQEEKKWIESHNDDEDAGFSRSRKRLISSEDDGDVVPPKAAADKRKKGAAKSAQRKVDMAILEELSQLRTRTNEGGKTAQVAAKENNFAIMDETSSMDDDVPYYQRHINEMAAKFSDDEQVDGSAEKVEIGSGVLLSKRTLRKINPTEHRKLTRDLMVALFTRDEMKNASVTRRKYNLANTTKKALDANKVQAIIDYVRIQHPQIEASTIRQTMAYKLRDYAVICAEKVARINVDKM